MENFNELNLSAPILKAITEMGFEKPSDIQVAALPVLLGEPTDFIGLAATGTGKTAAFSVPLLERLDVDTKNVQALVLCPTRELAIQVAQQIELIGRYVKMGGIRALPVYGGSSFGDQISGIKRGAQVVVGTPGRLVDHLKRGTLSLENVKTVILDEADEMISMGFKEDLEFILAAIPEGQSNTWLFSATMSPGVRSVASEYLENPQQVQVNRGGKMLPENVEQLYYVTQESNKPEVLCKLVESADDFYGLVFFQTKALLVEVADFLSSKGFKVDCLHGDMDQNARERTMKAFRERRVSMLLCTDVASRGLDVKDVTHVINYSLPRELDSYVHRIGRTARSGKAGVAMSLVTNSHKGLVRRIEKMTNSRMIETRVPSRKEIAMRKVTRQLATFAAQDHWGKVVEVMGNEWRDAVSTMMPDEIAARFLALMNPDLFADLRGAQGEPVVKVERETRLADRPDFSGELEDRRELNRERRRERNERDDRNVFVPEAQSGKKGRYVHEHGRFQVKSEEQIEPAVVEFREGSAAEPIAPQPRIDDRKEGGFPPKKRFDRKPGGFGKGGFGNKGGFGGKSGGFGGSRPWQRRDDRRAGGFADRHAGGAGITPVGEAGSKPAFPGLKKKWNPAGGVPQAGFGGKSFRGGKPRWKT
jgi:ATP-dependent RNA helicase DeaD